MEGQVLSASDASNQGVILGDDGARYILIPREWRGGSVKAAAGMRVDFEDQGSYAVYVRPIQCGANAADGSHQLGDGEG